MKWTFFLCFVVFFLACKKAEEPIKSNPITNPSLFIYRTYGFKSFDTVQIKVNGIVKFADPSGYNVQIEKGDAVDVFIVGRIDSAVNQHDFAIWKNENVTPDKTIKFLYPVPRYSNKFLIQGSFTAP